MLHNDTTLPDLESLRCFAAAARLGSFRAAARAVALTPAAVGQRIRALEEQLGTALFARTTRRNALTEAGLRLLPRALQTLDAAELCIEAGRGDSRPSPIELTVGTRHELGMSWLVPIRPCLQRAHPGLQMHLYFGSGRDLLANVRNMTLDCAVTSTRITDPALDAHPLHREEYLFVASPHLLERAPLRNETNAAAHTLVDVDRTLPLFSYWRDAPGGIDSLRFGRILTMGTIAAVRAVVLQREGVAVLPRYFVAKDIKKRRLRVIWPRIHALHDHFRLVFRADDARRERLTALAKTMMQYPLR